MIGHFALFSVQSSSFFVCYLVFSNVDTMFISPGLFVLLPNGFEPFFFFSFFLILRRMGKNKA